VIEKGAELDLAIAEDVRVGRAAGAVFLKEMGEHPVPVFPGEADEVERDLQPVADGHGVDHVLPGRAELVGVVALPVLHEQALDRVTLLLEQQGGNGGIHPAGHADDDLHALAHRGAHAA